MNETRVFDGLGQIGSVAFREERRQRRGPGAMRERADNWRLGPDSLGCCAVRSVRKQS
jgi:hypothetical protein